MNKDISAPQDLQGFAELFEKAFPGHGFRWKPYPNRWMGLCPFHEDKNPSFNIFVTPDGTLAYKCFGCGASGTAYSILSRLGYQGKYAKSGDWALMKLAELFAQEAKQELINALAGNSSLAARQLKAKVIPKHSSVPFKQAVGFYNVGLITDKLLSKWWGDENKRSFIQKADGKANLSSKVNYIVFPYYGLNGLLTALKFRDIAESSRSSRVLNLFQKRIPAYFGGLGFLQNFIKRTDGWVKPVGITEGETDSISFYLASGIPSLSVGSASNYGFILESKVSEYDFFPVILPDYDEWTLKSMGPGREAVVKLYDEIKRSKCAEKVYVYTAGYKGAKDVNEALVAKGTSTAELLGVENSIQPIRDAAPLFRLGWQDWKYEIFQKKSKELEESIPGIANAYRDFLKLPRTKEYSTEDIENVRGNLDVILGRFPTGMVSVVASFGGTGKTMYAIMLAYKISALENRKTLLWTTEHSAKSLKGRLKRVSETDALKDYYNTGKNKVFFKTGLPAPFVNQYKELVDEPFNEIKRLLEEYDILILDPWLAFVSVDENDNVVARKVIERLNSLLTENKSIIFLHHFGKMALKEALIDDKDVALEDNGLVKIDRSKVQGLTASIRGASAICDAARYVESVVITTQRKRYIITIKTNEDTRQEGCGEEIPELAPIQTEKDQLCGRVKSIVLANNEITVTSPIFEMLDKYGVITYSDFESHYKEIPMQVLKDFVCMLERKVGIEKDDEDDLI